MINFRKIIIIFFPDFTYEYESSLIKSLETISQKVEEFDGDIIEKDEKKILFVIKASKILGKFSFGNLFIQIFHNYEGDVFRIKVQFVTHKFIFFTISIILSILIIISTTTTNDLTKLLSIPIIFVSGHTFFWGIIPSKIKKIKRALMEA